MSSYSTRPLLPTDSPTLAALTLSSGGSSTTIAASGLPKYVYCGGVDDTAAVQAALDAANESTVVIIGTCALSDTLVMGNGSSSAVSTKNRVILRGASSGLRPWYSGFPAAVTKIIGPASKPIIKMAGPGQGFGIEDLYLDGETNNSTIGIDAWSAQYPVIQRVTVNKCTDRGIYSRAYAAIGGVSSTNSVAGRVRDVIVIQTTSSVGVHLSGDSSGPNTNFWVLDNIHITDNAGVGSHPLILGNATGNLFLNVHTSAASSTVILDYTETGQPGRPSGNIFYFSNLNFANSGTPTSPGSANYVYGYITNDGHTPPSGIDNLINASAIASVASPLSYNTATGALTVPTNPLDLGSGGQVKFPATQSASSDANTLDDYEEGTFTPTLAFATPGNSSFAYSVQTGSYTKIGNLVYLEIALTFTPTIGTGSGNLLIAGIPFTIATDIQARGTAAGMGATYTWPAGTTQIICAPNSTTDLRLVAQGSATAAVTIGAAHLTSGSAHPMRISIVHRV